MRNTARTLALISLNIRFIRFSTLDITTAPVVRVPFQLDIDQRGFTRVKRPAECRLNLIGLDNVFAVSAQGLDHPATARMLKHHRNVFAVHRTLRPHHLAPGCVVPDDAHDG